ncbi:methionyl-tRNA formyltransferase [Geosporobacter ferrireducens]|uniref:Polymyxin resistance protein ArnA n=1 Tax=Geosporobacter ferrireducens TaxID=1424294 RepID=A0A1D8GGW1_9FIRM|nr:methionyl-tRNA formyltransferase [Geosporobacter ferrireducens]AOT70138.1 polymyxin resistance protein ArnA [Geosporobacter ferrireducens]
MKSILIGSVGSSSKTLLQEMVRLNFPVEMVFSLDEQYSLNVSGYYPIHQLAEKHNIPYRKFKRINDKEHTVLIKEINPDYIFVIGLSQLIGKEIIESAKKGVIGSHPTPLPKFRGRAAMVWQMLLGIKESKCSMFFIDEGIDSGDIIGQEDYFLENTDYAIDAERKVTEAFGRLARRILPEIMNNNLKSIKQNEEEATYLLKRLPEDGLINWQEPVEQIHRLIRAVSKPYPGAFSYYDGKDKVVFWRADFMENKKYIGLPGQIAKKTEEYLDVVCIDGLLRIYDFECTNSIKIREGYKFK